MDADLQPCRRPELPQRLAGDVGAATDEVLARVLEEIPLYRTLDAVQLADVRATVAAGYHFTLQLWETGQVASPELLRSFRANGSTRAAEGRPLPLVLRAYRVSCLGIYDYIVNHPDADLDAEEERNLARLTMIVVDQLSNEVTVGYVETTGQLASQQGRARREFLEDLLSGRLLAPGEVSERAATLGLTLPRKPCLLVAAPAAGEGASLADRARAAVQQLAPAGAMQLITRGQLVVVHEATDPEAVRRALGFAGLTGITLAVADLADLAATYQRAREAHEFLLTARVPHGHLVDDNEALVLALLARAREADTGLRAVSAILGELMAPANAPLLDTLDAYLIAGNAVSAAHRLGIHAQTMRYRLKRIRDLTGRDPAHGWDRFVLEFALRLTGPAAASA